MGVKAIFFISFSWAMTVGASVAQDPMEELDQARSLLEQKQYTAAAARYLALYKDGPFELQPMAGLYYGVCLYYQGSYAEAEAHLEEVDSCYVDAPLRDQLLYWKGRSAMSRNDIDHMLMYFDMIEEARYQRSVDSCIHLMARAIELKRRNLRYLAFFYERAPALYLKDKLQEALLRYVPPGEEAMLDTLFSTPRGRKYGLQLLKHARLEQKTYHIAVLLPFFFNPVSDNAPYTSSFVWDLYKGLSSAQQALERRGVLLQLHPYDTERSLPKTLSIIDSLAQKKLHLIVGPLYVETIAAVQAFALRNEVPMLNPLSSNPVLNTGFDAWLFTANDLTQARATSKYVSTYFTKRTAAVFCEDEARVRDSCGAYARMLRKEGFEVRFERYLSQKQSIELRDQLCVVKRSLLEDVAPDSVPEPEEGYVFRKGQGKYAEQEEQWYKEHWEVQPNEIGHIFVMARHPSFLSYAISAVEQRPDTIPIITQAHWLHQPQSDYAQFERLGVQFIDPSYIPLKSRRRRQFVNEFFSNWSELPSYHATLGHEIGWIMGEAMHQYGDNFMYMLQRSGDQRVGRLGLNLRYLNDKKDNQQLSVLMIKDAEIEVLYTYEAEEASSSK